jgi:predicted DNA-binding transcriptional regulator YafY
MAKDLFNRYIRLVDTIYRAGKITFEEINERWLRNEMSEGKELPLRTFHNHRTAVEEIFDIIIDCDKRNGYAYFIGNRDDMERGGVHAWLLNTFAVNNLINESHKLKSRILFEQIPSGQQFLTPVIEAMRDGVRIEMTYQGFWHSEPCTVEIEPYCVKIFRQRWYVIGRNLQYDALRTYSLDRIRALFTTDRAFQLPKEFRPDAFFENSFGIIVDENIEPCTVKIKVYGKQRQYFRTLPLHPSQEEVETAEDYSVFSYFIAPTFDFTQEIFSHGSNMEVLSPESFRREIAETVRKMNVLYK